MKTRYGGMSAALLFLVAGRADAQDHIDIVQIWQNFIASAVAENNCAADKASSDHQFLSNLTAVTIRATQRLQEENPTITPADLVIKMNVAGEGIGDKVTGEIKQNGCSSPKIQMLLKMYRMHAAMKF